MDFLRPAFGEVGTPSQVDDAKSHLQQTTRSYMHVSRTPACVYDNSTTSLTTLPMILQVLLDLSCGSGLFTRRFVASNKFKGVIAADFSESMLQQTKQLFDQDQLLDGRWCLDLHACHCLIAFTFGSLFLTPCTLLWFTELVWLESAHAQSPDMHIHLGHHKLYLLMCAWLFRKLALVRADVARLPFATGSLAAIHAGAAIHCWPDPTAAVRKLWCCCIAVVHCYAAA